MFTNYFKQITLATIGTGCIALGLATEAQAFGTLNISNQEGFSGNENSIDFFSDDTEYSATGVLDFLNISSDTDLNDGSVFDDFFAVPGGAPITSFFTFNNGSSTFNFDLESITFADTIKGKFSEFIMYDLMGTITDDMGKTYKLVGGLTSQTMGPSGATGSSWSVTLQTVPEPSTMIGLGVVAAASAFGLKKKNS